MAMFLAEGRVHVRTQNRKDHSAFKEQKQSSVAGMQEEKCLNIRQERQAFGKSWVMKGIISPVRFCSLS